MNNGELPFELKFFSGDEKDKNLLTETAKQHVRVLNDSNEFFLNYLSSKYGCRVLKRNKMKIHFESGQIFIDIQITGEILYDFLRVQQDLTKKILKVNVAITDDFDYYLKEVLANITNDRYDLNSNSTSKFLFYQLNTVREAQGKSFLENRHSEIADNDWQYFVETLLFVASNQLSEFEESEKDILEKNILKRHSWNNLKYCKDYYQTRFHDTAYFFYRYIKKINNVFVEKMEDDISREIYFHKPLKSIENARKLLKLFSQFFFKTGRSLDSENLVIVLMGVMPSL